MRLLFIETPTFQKQIDALLDREAQRGLQNLLLANPQAGDLIQGTGGLRKLRFGEPGRGKRGGLRIIYYYRVNQAQILLLLAYRKARQTDLTSDQKALLKQWVEKWDHG